MIYAFKIAVIISAYITVSIIGAYFIILLLKEIREGGGKWQPNGCWHGEMIERIIVLTFVLLNQYTTIAIIFAAKSIARFNELKDGKIAEYYLIGTLLSIAFAMIVGVATRLIIEGGIV